MSDARAALADVQRRLAACKRCPNMVGPVVQGRPNLSRIYLVGQAPGPHEGEKGRPFAWTAGKQLFKWFATLGVDEESFRSRAYMAAVARCFPGKAKTTGDRKPDANEIAACRTFMDDEVRILKPKLVIPVGGLAIEQIMGGKPMLADVVGQTIEVAIAGEECDAIALPHPSGASTWHKMEPGKSLLAKALKLLGEHPVWKATFGSPA